MKIHFTAIALLLLTYNSSAQINILEEFETGTFTKAFIKKYKIKTVKVSLTIFNTVITELFEFHKNGTLIKSTVRKADSIKTAETFYTYNPDQTIQYIVKKLYTPKITTDTIIYQYFHTDTSTVRMVIYDEYSDIQTFNKNKQILGSVSRSVTDNTSQNAILTTYTYTAQGLLLKKEQYRNKNEIPDYDDVTVYEFNQKKQLIKMYMLNHIAKKYDYDRKGKLINTVSSFMQIPSSFTSYEYSFW